jgi:hypothetical protein
MNPIFTGYIDGESLGVYIPFLRLVNPSRLGDYLKNLNGQDIELIIRKPKTSRSDNQSRYYFGVVVELLANELGYDKDEMHEILKYKFLQSNSMGLPYVKSTTKLSTGEFEDYLSKIKRWAAEFLHITIPDPGEAE